VNQCYQSYEYYSSSHVFLNIIYFLVNYELAFKFLLQHEMLSIHTCNVNFLAWGVNPLANPPPPSNAHACFYLFFWSLTIKFLIYSENVLQVFFRRICQQRKKMSCQPVTRQLQELDKIDQEALSALFFGFPGWAANRPITLSAWYDTKTVQCTCQTRTTMTTSSTRHTPRMTSRNW